MSFERLQRLTPIPASSGVNPTTPLGFSTSRGFPLDSSVTASGFPPSWRSPNHRLATWPAAPPGSILPRSVALIPPGWTNRARSPHGLFAPPANRARPTAPKSCPPPPAHVMGRLYRNHAHKERIPIVFARLSKTVGGATWLRRRSRNLRGMPRGRYLVNPLQTILVANDDNYALAA